MSVSTQTRSRLLREMASRARFVSLHVGDPGGTGEHEVAGEFYQRQPVGWDGTWRNTHEVRFVLPDVTVTHVGYWDIAQGGAFQFGAPLPRETRMDEGDAGRFAPGALSLDVRD